MFDAAPDAPRREVLAAYDITLQLDGEEYQPEAGSPLEVCITDPAIREGMELELWHIHNDGATEQITDFTVEGNSIRFMAESFSVYLVCAYTVDFHWGDYTYSIEGESEITLGALLEKLGVTEIRLDDVAAVSFSNPEYIEIEQLDSDWLLRSLAPFSSEEALTLTLKNGETVEIKVTDENENEGTESYTVVWKNWNDSILETDKNVPTGTIPQYDGETPTKTEGESKYYFTGWTPEIAAAAGDAEYTAQFALCTPLTITAVSDSRPFNNYGNLENPEYTLSGDLQEGHTVNVTVKGSQHFLGSSDNIPSDAKIVDAAGNDVTYQYDISYVNGTLTVTWPEGMIRKELTEFQGNLATYQITVNPEGLLLMENGEPLTLMDTFSENQSIDYDSVNIASESVESAIYDFSSYTGTYTIPSDTTVTITYTTRVKGQVGKEATFFNTAVLGLMEETGFVPGPTVTVNETKTITPTGTDISGTGGVYTIDLFAYAEGHMEHGLEGAAFRLLDSNMRPMYYAAGTHAGEQITFTTGPNGYVPITLNEESDGLAIHKNTVYFLEMITAPFESVGGEYVYYQKDNTFYSFLITDEPSYQYGSIYSYFNGDVLKVRCYPEAKGVNVTKRFSGNYTLTNEQKNAITFVLQKEALSTADGWIDVESHTYKEFSYGSINFQTGREGGTELEDFATYRMVERFALPEELAGVIEENVTVSVSYQREGQPVYDESNEFTVDPDDKYAFSYDFAFTNEYIDHKLTIIKINENTGAVLPGAVFTVYAANDAGTPVKTYTADADGSITIRKGDEGVNYVSDTLYYVVETGAPEGHNLPADPEKVYFCFSENGSGVPAGLPAGASAIDLTTSYDTITLSNSSEKVNVPVIAVWGINGRDPWPENVNRIVVGLYKSVGGAEAEPVVEDGQPMTLELTEEKFYDTTTFTGLPAREEEKNITYSIVEEGIYGTDEADISGQFASSSNISGTGWYVVNNQDAVSVVVKKAWLDLNGNPVADTSEKPEVTFDLYRMTAESDETGLTRDALDAFLAGAECVRTGLKLSAPDWSTTVDSLQKTDKQGHSYYYYALEQVPDNHEDSYTVAPATDTEPRTLTISNKQTPFTVTIAVNDLENTYGDEIPAYTFTADVKEDGATVEVSGPDAEGKYTATVTSTGSVSPITFTVSRDSSEDAGTYTVTPSGEALQSGYRVLYESGTLTIKKAPVKITAGAEKIYGDTDPALVKVEGMKNDEDPGTVLNYTVSREEGEDVGEYSITLTGETEQKNYTVTYVRRSEDDKPYTLKINRAPVTVTAKNSGKIYGDDEPEFEATVTGLKFTDEPTVLSYDLTRTAGEDIGSYPITPSGEAAQGNYSVIYEPAVFTISAAALTVKVEDDEKTYGDADPEWEVTLDGLTENDNSGELTSALNQETGARDYTFTLGEGESAKTLLTFSVSREAGENVGTYTITPSGEATQGNYTLSFKKGKLTIQRAELTVSPDHVVKAVGLAEDPLLTATVTGWKNGDDEAAATHEVGTDENAGTITWTYKRGEGEDAVTLLTFTLKRDAGEEEGEYPIKATGDKQQSNYVVEYEEGIFGILAILDIDVTQPLVDHADADANPTYTYTATLDLTGTGLTEYEKDGFELVDGVLTRSFTLPTEDKANMVTLKIPGGAKLTVRQDTANNDYTTAIRLDGASYESEDPVTCGLDNVVTYHEIAFTHSRISLPVSARAAAGQTEEGATPLEGREGAMGIPDGESESINADFADEMHSKIGYVLSSNMYYVYDHASLYTKAGDAISDASNITEIKYDSTDKKWQYKTDGDFADVPEDAQLVLFYLPEFVCKIGDVKFYSLKKAVEYASENSPTAKIEMLIEEYSIRSASDAVTIPANCNITITTAETEYEGTGTAIISRSLSYPGGHLFDNRGTLTFDNIILDGKNVPATDATVLNEANLTFTEDATLRSAIGNNGGAIYAKTGAVTVNGTLSGNTATSGGAVYVNAGTFTLGSTGSITGSSATTGGAVYVNDGTITIGGTIGGTGEGEGNTATTGGAVYLTKGSLTVSGTLTENTAASGGAVYQAGGTLTVSGSMSENTSTSNGGAVYQANGTLTVEESGSLSDNSAAENGGAVYQANGTLTNSGEIRGNSAANGGGIYRVNGMLTVGGTLSGNTASENGGGFYTTGGTVNVTATFGGEAEGAGNSAANGGAIYVSGTTLNLNGAKFSGNKATTNGGAVYALNANTVIGGTWSNNAATEGTAASFNGNAATGNGGAVYMEGGSVTVKNANSTLTDNSAINGGGIYATSGAITVNNGWLESNEATANGGAIYAESASVTVNGGVLGGTGKGNKANQGNGGAIYAGSGTVTISGGTLSGNSAGRGESEDTTLGLGGAIYAGTGTVNYTGGAINGGNTAVNGAAIFVGTGIANISASITANTATNGGAVGVGSTNTRLNFKADAEVNNNTMNGAQSNVYLDVDSELVINADSLNNGKKIGIYVPGEVDSDQVVKHGDVTGYFGAYVSAGTLGNISNVFKSDRFGDLKVAYENNRMYWINNLKYDIYYLKNYDSQFPPTSNYTSAPSKNVVSDKTYAPRTRESDIYDLVMAMKLYEAHNDDFTKNVGSDYASTAVYAYTFSDKAMSGFTDYLKSVEWDAVARKWKYTTQSGTEITNTSKLVIFYSAPAYLTIVNNNTSGLELDISELTVLNQNAAQGLYGFVTAKNGATVTTLRTITEHDMKLAAGDSIKLMLPGAQDQRFTIRGEFVGSGEGEIKYTFNGGAEQPISGTTVDFSSDSFMLNSDDEAAEIVFGDALPICKIGDVTFSRLQDAVQYMVDHDGTEYTVEMLVDYLIPSTDVLDIPSGYQVTFTTSQDDDFRGANKGADGAANRAILSRDTGNSGSSVSATNSILTVDNLAFDGRSLTAGGKGGAISTTNCATVTITNSEFKGYRADNGGAIYVENRNAGSSLTVEHCDFYNCQTNASVDKAGGGGIWTTARELYVRNCTFDFCACLAGNAQAGSIFHNIQKNWSANSKTVISGCTFSNSYSVGGSGGTIESDALDVTIENCEFHGSYTNKDKGNGGAINALAGDAGGSSGTGWIGNYDGECWLTVKNCLFDGCRAARNGNGGAIVSSMWYVTLENCKFVNTQSKYGGAVRMTNSNAKWLHISGCTFENCVATDTGGGVSAPVPEIKIEDSVGGTFLDGTENDGATYFTDCVANRGGGIDNAKDDASVTMENVRFTRCVAKTGNGGALYTQAKTLSITGTANTFTNCTGYGSGGAVFQKRDTNGTSVNLENCVFSGCEANNGGLGGGMYAHARTLTISGENNSFVNCTAAKSGGGLCYDYSGTASIENCAFTDCTAKAEYGGGLYTVTHALTITGEGSNFTSCTAQKDGGGLYQNRDANGSTFTFRDGSFDGCTAVGDAGGAIYTKAKTVTLEDCAVKDSTAKANGGGVWIYPSTASFDGCTITGNSVTNSDSKGGGVYVPGGTTTFKNSTVSGCEAANGGGWYQANGTLYILGGSISGSATNGGGLYMNDGNTKVYQYGGTVGGTAAGNGGGVYKNNGSYTVGNGTYNEAEYTGGASIGGLIVLTATVDGEETTTNVTSSAVNGGGVYNANGTLYLVRGGSIGSVETNEAGETFYTATATNGGGVYVANGALAITGGVITNCSATGNGGGIYYASTSNDGTFYAADSSSKIQNCLAANGGGIYMTGSKSFQMGLSGGTSLGTIENCSATENGGGVYVAGGTFNHRNTSCIVGCTAENNGGGIYQSGGTLWLYDDARVKNNQTGNNGGGIYHAGGTFTFKKGSIVGNTATGNGGGVYHAGGTFKMTDGGAVIGGSRDDANTANIGAGVFVADGQTATFSDNSAKALEISYNHAVTAGGGIAVGGPNAVLTFQNAVTVRHNTMGSQNIACNVYLDQDRNTVIKNNALDTAAYIGVYASDEQDAGHGVQGKPFGTYNGTNSGNLNVYHNDRRIYLYGMKGSSNNEVIWPEFVCKITDDQGNLLYKDANGTPAVYTELENRASSATNSAGAFTTLNVAGTPALYQKDKEGNYSLYNTDGTGEYQVQMLVQNYEMGSTRQIKLDAAAVRKVRLTTASATEDECGFKYTGDARFNATITRTAATSCMIFVGTYNGWDLTLGNITLDGGNYSCTETGAILRVVGTGKASLDTGAVLQNGKTNNQAGGAVYIDNSGVFTMNAGSAIKGSSAGTSNGGGVYVTSSGTFTMNGGTISGCTAANGGGVYLYESSASFTMKGGEITGNSATAAGGGVTHNKDKTPTITFSGYCSVMGNTLNGVRCNVQLTRDTNAIINANGLDSRSEIGVYTADGTIYTNHGEPGDPFGTWGIDGDKLFCFINDRNTNFRGFQSVQEGDKKIYWEYHPLLTVFKEVESDWSHDRNDVAFTFEVRLPEKTSMTQAERRSIKGMSFSAEGVATFSLKAGESKTAEFPNDFDMVGYVVKEVLTTDAQADYTTAAERNGRAYAFPEDKPLTVSGKLGENIGTENSSSLSTVTFTNTRKKDALIIKAVTVSTEESDNEESFDYTLTLADTTISKAYPIGAEDSTETLTFKDGVAAFSLKHGESITIRDLPTDLPYTVVETLNDEQKTHIRTQVSRNGSDPVYEQSQEGKIGEKSPEEVVFTNNFLEIVCKITNRSRALLYYRDTQGNLQPAIFAHLEDAFDQINSGNLRTSGNGTVSGQLRIEMVVPEYTMERSATLDRGKNVLLSTALTSDGQYPYNKGVDDGNGNISTVTRGFTDGSMIATSGALTIDKITLDGANTADEPVTTNASGGIVQVNGAVKLTVNSAATLQNSTTSGNGGAIWLNTGASLTMNGTIENCAAENGGGVYADTGFAGITTTGTISGCEATGGNGGAIYASTGSSVNLNAGTLLTANTATGNGGAVYSEANVVLRGTVGGAEANDGNAAGGDGGGIYMGENVTFTMYAGSSISGNSAANGGGLATASIARIAGGTLQNNSATGNGGAVYGSDTAIVTISGVPVITGNKAVRGGAVYDGGSLTMTGGSMTANTASEKGGAVYVADSKTFTMSGGNIKEENKSPEGAVSTDENAVLAFSGNAVVRGNTDLDGTKDMNVFLGYDSNSIITTSGLGANADIGVYVADGEPEDESVPDHVDNPIYADHGLSARNFGTYTGSSLSSARLNKFVNDRDNSLTGMPGAGVPESSNNYIVWNGKGLQLKVSMIKTDGTVSPAEEISFTLTNSDNVQVWSGKSDKDGLVTIPYGPEEKANGNVAVFAPKSSYTLSQIAANTETVLPAGVWTVAVARDNAVTWTAEPTVSESVDRILEITSSKDPGEKAYLGETFGVNNDVKPTLTYDATGGKLSDNLPQRTDTIAFKTTETNHTYTILEINPTWDSHVFKRWATMESKPTGDGGTALTDDELIEQGYFEYEQNGKIVFFRGTEEQKNTQGSSKGDLTLFAQWDEVVCKITDRDGTLLYINGSPAVYGSLKDGFADYNDAGTYTFTYANGSRATARRIEMLIPAYTLAEGVEVKRGKTVMLTTAPWDDTDGYAYTGEQGTACVITRGESCDTSMITNYSNLTLGNIVLDGDNRTVLCDGGLVRNARTSAVLTIANGAILRNSAVEGNGGAVNASAGTTVNLTGGAIIDNSCVNGAGAGIYLAAGSVLNLSGAPDFGGTGVNADGTLDTMRGNFASETLSDETNGGAAYTRARQDIYISGTAEPHRAIRVTGAITSGNGTIWVWAEHENHYDMLKQFAVYTGSGTAPEDTMKAFRNAQPDSLTNCGGDYLTGQKGDDINGYKCIYWTGGFDFVFRKIDGYGKPLDGATFTLYRANAEGTDILKEGGVPVAYQVNGTSGKVDATATSRKIDSTDAVTIKYTTDGGLTISDKAIYGDGLVTFSKIPPATYFLVETAAPEVNGKAYATTQEMYRIVLDGKGWYSITVEKDDSGASTWTKEALTTSFANDGSGKYTETDNTSATDTVKVYEIMNLAPFERKVILRKVNGSFAPLPNMSFTIYRYDGTIAATGTSTNSGVIWIGKLQYGKYTLLEDNGVRFTLTVGNDTVKIEDGKTVEATPGSRDGVTVK